MSLWRPGQIWEVLALPLPANLSPIFERLQQSRDADLGDDVLGSSNRAPDHMIGVRIASPLSGVRPASETLG
jgi:hypothetical protein